MPDPIDVAKDAVGLSLLQEHATGHRFFGSRKVNGDALFPNKKEDIIFQPHGGPFGFHNSFHPLRFQKGRLK